MAIPGSSSGSQPPLPTQITTKHNTPQQLEVESVKCHSCGFTEDCTLAYISRVRDRHQGRWICGLCVEAVKDEVLRSKNLISSDEALNRHINFCQRYRSSSPLNQTEHPIFVMGRILRRSLDSHPRALRSNSSSVLPDVEELVDDRASLVRSESCFSAFSR